MWRILVAEDNFLGRKLLLEILKSRADCDAASNGKEALEAYMAAVKEGKPYQLILLDIAMPEMTGVEVLGKIRENENQCGVQLGEGVPIIMVTAYKEPVIEAFNKGCDDYITKPIQPTALLKKIEEKLGRI